MSGSRRQHRRYRVAELQGTLQFAHPIVILDLSRSGAAVETAERLVPNRSYAVQLQGADGTITPTLARVVWCTLTGAQTSGAGPDAEGVPIYRAGLQFLEPLGEPLSSLLERLEIASAATFDTRLNARYKMSDLASTLLLRDRTTFEVRTLSRSGMGAEMDYCPRVGAQLEFVLLLDEPLELKGRVADVRPATEEPRRFMVGIEFVSVGSVAQGRLDRYIDGLRAGADANSAD